MLKIEELIGQWRKTLGSQIGPERLEEIEAHLRELIESNLQKGLEAEDAFQKAVQRLGAPERISAEFEKLQPSMWWPARVAISVGVLAAVFLPAALAVRFAGKPSDYVLVVHVFAITMGYSIMFLLGGVGICYVLQRSMGELTPGRMRSLNRVCFGFGLTASVLTGIGIILSMVWAQRAWGRPWSWDPKELGGAATLTWLICVTIFAKRQLVSARALMLMNVLGNILVGISWFGPIGANIFSVLAIIVVGSLGFFLLGLAPAGFLQRRSA